MSEGYALPQYKPMSGNDRQILERGDFTGVIRGYERYGLFFADSIGYRISPDGGSDTPLFYVTISMTQSIGLYSYKSKRNDRFSNPIAFRIIIDRLQYKRIEGKASLSDQGRSFPPTPQERSFFRSVRGIDLKTVLAFSQ